MNDEAFQGFLRSGIILCVVMSVFSTLFRWKRFGPSALALGSAFCVFALLLFGFKEGWPQSRIIAVAVVLALLLVADAMLRSNVDLRK